MCIRELRKSGLSLSIAGSSVQLGEQQSAMYGVGAEPAAVLVVQVVDDELRQAGDVGSLQQRQEVPALVGVQRRFGQPFPRGRLEALDRVGAVGEGPRGEGGG